MTGTLRGRLALASAVVLAVALGAFGLLASRTAERSAREAVDERLRRTAELSAPTAVAAVNEELPERDRRLDAVLSATSSTSLRLLVGERTLLETGAPPPTRAVPRLGLRTVEVDGRRFRVLATRPREAGLGDLAVLEVATPLRGVEDRQGDLDRSLLLLGAGALLLAALGVLAASHVLLAPLRRAEALAAAIAEDEDLGRRMPVEHGPRELRSLAASFNAMLARLETGAAARERALAATRRFAADAGHELRTPLTSVLTTLSTLRRHPGVDPARRDALLDDALAEHRRLVSLLDGLQGLARGDAAPPEATEADLAELAADAAGPDVVLDLPEVPVPVRGWEPGLRLVAANLVANARRHGAPPVGVRVAREGADAVLEVRDHGPGIPAAERHRVFEAFVRLDADRPGSGLGLALVAQQVGHHGGTVSVGDAPGGGAVVTVRLPGAWA